ncbi:NADAR family protein [Thermosynechococcus sp. QKsg1]|uniref:NADAR family protein n=1 Tax=unclassified Thermosynechococcus TaxID=2622553 RepID=UPI001D047231|nr:MULTISPECIES: NADAR family protein [unclassified Thermosynechococcus]WJI25304.1 NADAR family protein [Thermosynechococcus sp. B0]WJI27834.1 NADAR family protein [Thermosynechococcus sp. B1]WJI30368.1 NADAR family protein [Thermosynechococcus sp. B3]WKT84947.1 NADAR family protein [Thermosynechococcus sp. HY596]WNC64081.1 NADAR family protein [Thermosynechococcus sp. HY591]
MTIYFYRVKDAYGSFSNFSPHGFTLEGYYWPTAEHYYQAHKFFGTAHEAFGHAIRIAPTPEAAAQLGRSGRYPVHPQWDQLKQPVMWRALVAKFTTHPDLRELLLATGDEELVEDSPVDSYWGCGGDRQGSNYLGRLLMHLRHCLRQGADLHTFTPLQDCQSKGHDFCPPPSDDGKNGQG